MLGVRGTGGNVYMVVAPDLRATRSGQPVQRRYALLINPFYPKDPRASYGKHVLNRGEPAGVRDLSHPDAVPWHTALPSTGS